MIMFSGLFDTLIQALISFLNTLFQIVLFVPNIAFIKFMPDLSDWIIQTTDTLNNVFNAISWGLSIIPAPLLSILIFIITVEIAKHTISLSVMGVQRLWILIQKIKVW